MMALSKAPLMVDIYFIVEMLLEIRLIFMAAQSMAMFMAVILQVEKLQTMKSTFMAVPI